MTSVKPFKWKNQWSNLYKKKQEIKNTYEPHQQPTTAEHQVHMSFCLLFKLAELQKIHGKTFEDGTVIYSC